MNLATRGMQGTIRIRTGSRPMPAFLIMRGRLFPSACGSHRAVAVAITDIMADITVDIVAAGADGAAKRQRQVCVCGEMYIL